MYFVDAGCVIHATLATEAVMCWSLMERCVELATALACSALTMHTDACNRECDNMLMWDNDLQLETFIATSVFTAALKVKSLAKYINNHYATHSPSVLHSFRCLPQSRA